MSRGREDGASSQETSLLSRNDIISAMVNALSPIDYVQAFWEGGAIAFGRNDEYSDIDAYLLVDDGKVEETFEVVERALESLSPIKQKYPVRQNQWPGVSQAFYRLERASEYLVLDLAILTSSSPTKFLEPEIHGKTVFYFNKSGLNQAPALDRQAFETKQMETLGSLRDRFRMFNDYVQKEIERGNSLEALEYYRTIIIPSLVEFLRAKYNPTHYDFRMRYVHYELPATVIKRLEDLCFVNGLEDLQRRYREALHWLNELTSTPMVHQA